MEDRGRLPCSLEECNRAKAQTVRDRVSADLSPPRRPGPPVYHLTSLHRYSLHLSGYAPGTMRGVLVADALFDRRLQAELEEGGALNWSRSERGLSLYALKNTGPSNSLLDAVCVSMWGVRDSDMVLRAALYDTLVRSSPVNLQLAYPEERTSTGQRVFREDWWKVVQQASPSTGAAQPVENPYQRVHLFVLANILRRPIVVLGVGLEAVEAAAGRAPSADPRGVYLPSLWEGAECHPYPVVLGSSSPWRRFAPLVMAGSAQEDGDEGALPLVWGAPGHLQELPLHFPPGGGGGARLPCLRAYLRLQTLSLGDHIFHAARLKGHNLPEPLSLVLDYFELANHACGQVTQEVCVMERCPGFSSKLTWPLCHSCYGNLHQHQPQLQVRSSPPEGRGDSVSDTPPGVRLVSGPSPASSSADADLSPPRELEYSPFGGGAESGGGGASDSDFLCGQCHACKKETRTFNGLCFLCLQSRTASDPASRPPLDPHPPAELGRASPEREESPGGRRCPTPGCMYFGTAQHGGYCTFCYCSQNQTQTHSPAPAPPPSSSSSSSSSPPRPPQLSSSLRSLPRCRGPACDMLGNPAFRWLCERCFLTGHQGATEGQASEPRPDSPRNERVSGQYRRPPSEPDPPSELTIAAHGESRQSPICSVGKVQALSQPHRPKLCLGRGCTNFGNSRCQGLCNSCFRSPN